MVGIGVPDFPQHVACRAFVPALAGAQLRRGKVQHVRQLQLAEQLLGIPLEPSGVDGASVLAGDPSLVGDGILQSLSSSVACSY